jgi:hypothetical protein
MRKRERRKERMRRNKAAEEPGPLHNSGSLKGKQFHDSFGTARAQIETLANPIAYNHSLEVALCENPVMTLHHAFRL